MSAWFINAIAHFIVFHSFLLNRNCEINTKIEGYTPQLEVLTQGCPWCHLNLKMNAWNSGKQRDRPRAVQNLKETLVASNICSPFKEVINVLLPNGGV